MAYTAFIYRPVKNAMQSGKKRPAWTLEFKTGDTRFIEPLMGWTGSRDTAGQVRLKFDSEEAAIEYCKKKALKFKVEEPKQSVFKPKSYASNFAFNRVTDRRHP